MTNRDAAPECSCEEFWPGQGHPPDCPTQQTPETLSDEELRQIKRSMDGTKVVMARELLSLRAENARLREAAQPIADALTRWEHIGHPNRVAWNKKMPGDSVLTLELRVGALRELRAALSPEESP